MNLTTLLNVIDEDMYLIIKTLDETFMKSAYQRHIYDIVDVSKFKVKNITLTFGQMLTIIVEEK